MNPEKKFFTSIKNHKSLKIATGIIILIGLLFLLLSNGGRWFVYFLCAVFSIIGFFLAKYIYGQVRGYFRQHTIQKYPRALSLKLIASTMGLFWITGALLYLIVFYYISHDVPATQCNTQAVFTNAEYLFRSMISSLDLFMLDVDSNVLDRLDNHEILKGLISIQAVVSFSCTVLMLLGLVYSRMAAYWKISHKTKITENKNHLYLFFGNNLPSSLLIKNGDTTLFQKDPNAVVVLIDEADIKDEATNDWESIVAFFTHKHKVFTVAENSEACVALAGQQFCDIDPTHYMDKDFDALEYVGLSSVKKLLTQLGELKEPQDKQKDQTQQQSQDSQQIQEPQEPQEAGEDKKDDKSSDPELHIFFMGDDEDRNIRNINVLAHDMTLTNLTQKHGIKPKIYCHARKNGPNRAIDDVGLKKGWDINIIDSSHLAIELLKADPECHPVHVMKMNEENPTTVDSAFNSMIIGFGEVGRDAFRFLYEYGTFLSSKSPADEAVKAKFECTIVDKDLDGIAGPLTGIMPGIFTAPTDTTNDKINFYSIDHNSKEFYSEVLTEDTLYSINYIVIAIDNSDEAMSLAVRIFELARKFRDNLWDLRIFVRCTDDTRSDSLQTIADHFNHGYGNRRENVPVIRIFGQPKKTYTYDMIISEETLTLAKDYYEKYCAINGGGKPWDVRHTNLSKEGLIDNLRKLRRSESQDISNAQHAYTKLILFRNSIGANFDYAEFCNRYFLPDGTANITGFGKGLKLPGLTDYENLIILNLAKLEKLRWNSAHKLLGYTFYEDGNLPDERSMRHNCLCDWSMLDAKSKKVTTSDCDYKKYDFCVIHTTLSRYNDYITKLESKNTNKDN